MTSLTCRTSIDGTWPDSEGGRSGLGLERGPHGLREAPLSKRISWSAR